MAAKQKQGRIRVGIGGWSYAPWRGVFYPKGLKQADELAYAASRLTSIEINATHYRLQNPKNFRAWEAATPEGFVFSVKGPRLITQQKTLAESGNFIKRFFANQYKRSAVPNGPKIVSGGALSPRGDWRMPSDASAATWLSELRHNAPETLD